MIKTTDQNTQEHIFDFGGHMDISNKELCKFLKTKGINYLYHANTVGTACTFIREKGLLSRGAVEDQELFQTEQKSDDDDKAFDVWNDIFLDVVDMHGYFPRQNLYGPVLFKYKVEVLMRTDLPEIWITKDNPMYWKPKQKKKDRYYKDLDEYVSSFDSAVKLKTIQTKMITFRDTNEPLTFDDYLVEIRLDDPGVRAKNTIHFVEAKALLKKAMKSVNMDKDLLKIRKCKVCTSCFCHQNYLNMYPSELERLFLDSK